MALHLTKWEETKGAFRRQKVWLTASNIPLHSWCLDTFKAIGNACGSFVTVHWQSMEALPLGSILLIVDVLDPQGIPSLI
ncbi:hypothetical protein AMTRI_Chr03g46190 [Amborella trichopoda]